MDSASELDTDELFFQQGEEGTYLGGPTRHPSLAPVELELEVAPLDSDQLARAGRFRRPVALLVSSLGVMFLLALALRRPAAEGYAAAADAPGLSTAVVTPPVASVASLEAPLTEPFRSRSSRHRSSRAPRHLRASRLSSRLSRPQLSRPQLSRPQLSRPQLSRCEPRSARRRTTVLQPAAPAR
jgi:hypothetical protein